MNLLRGLRVNLGEQRITPDILKVVGSYSSASVQLTGLGGPAHPGRLCHSYTNTLRTS